MSLHHVRELRFVYGAWVDFFQAIVFFEKFYVFLWFLTVFFLLDWFFKGTSMLVVSLLLPTDGFHSDKVECVWFEKLASVPIGGRAIIYWGQKIRLLLHPLLLNLIIVLGIDFWQFKFCFVQIRKSFFIFLDFLLYTEFQRIFCPKLVLKLLVIKQAWTTFKLRQPLWTYDCVDLVSSLNFILNLRQIPILTALVTRTNILSPFLEDL